jgi:hypothetical protein
MFSPDEVAPFKDKCSLSGIQFPFMLCVRDNTRLLLVSPILLTAVVRKCLSGLLLSRHLCYKPEHA